MTPECINRTDRKPAYRLEAHANMLFRLVTDDDGLIYKQQLNTDGCWSEWHPGDWPGDLPHAFLVPQQVLTYPPIYATTLAPGTTYTTSGSGTS